MRGGAVNARASYHGAVATRDSMNRAVVVGTPELACMWAGRAVTCWQLLAPNGVAWLLLLGRYSLATRTVLHSIGRSGSEVLPLTDC